MSEEVKFEQPRNHRRTKAKVIAATAVTALAGSFAPSAHAENHHSQAHKRPKKPPKAQVYSGPLKPNQLPGKNINVKPEIRRGLEEATVELLTRPSGLDPRTNEPYGWAPNCTAVKVDTGQGFFVRTAAHCFVATTGEGSGAFTSPISPNDKAENYVDVGMNEYAIGDPNLDYASRMANPIALVNGVSISTDNKDIALLSYTSDGMGDNSRYAMDVKPALPINTPDKAHIPGEHVALFGMSQATGFSAERGTGTYLGTVSYVEVPKPNTLTGANTAQRFTRQVVLVGINPVSTNADNCFYGDSGSQVRYNDGTLSGPLSMRFNTGYGPNKKVTLPDILEYSNYWRTKWGMDLNEDFNNFSTVCGFQVVDNADTANLVDGFNHRAPFK